MLSRMRSPRSVIRVSTAWPSPFSSITTVIRIARRGRPASARSLRLRSWKSSQSPAPSSARSQRSATCRWSMSVTATQGLVHPAVDRDDGVPDRGREGDLRRLGGVHGAFGRVGGAEIDPGGDRAGLDAGADGARDAWAGRPGSARRRPTAATRPSDQRRGAEGGEAGLQSRETLGKPVPHDRPWPR